MSYIYLSSPYSHRNYTVMCNRYYLAMDAVCWLLKQRKWVHSPIVHCHELAARHDMPTDAKFWRDYNETMLLSAHTLYVLNTPGVHESKGVEGEIEFAEQERKPIFWLTLHAESYIPSRHHRSIVV